MKFDIPKNGSTEKEEVGTRRWESTLLLVEIQTIDEKFECESCFRSESEAFSLFFM